MTQISGAARDTQKEEASRYVAFISYRHVEPDRMWAQWLHTALETYQVPRRLCRERGVPRTVGRVFRDEEELSASSNLSEEIDEALLQSRYLIVICSRHTPASRWVDEEVRRFISLGRQDRILALLVDGEPDEAFPRPLREAHQMVDGKPTPIEPLAADVRPPPRHRGHVGGHARAVAKLRLIAALLGVRYDDLRQRDRARRRRRRLLTGLATGLSVAVVAAVAWLGISGRSARRVADLQAQVQALSEGGDWSVQRLDQAETAITRLRELNPSKADDARRAFYARMGAAIDRRIRQARLELTDVTQIREGLDLLAAKAPDQAADAARRKALADRLTDWELVAELAPPFDNGGELLDGSLRPTEDRQTLRVGRHSSDPEWAAVTLTRIAVADRIRVEVTYLRKPEAAPIRAGVTLGVEKAIGQIPVSLKEWGPPGYSVVTGDKATELRRNAAILRESRRDEKPVLETVPETLRVTKVGQHFTIQVADEPPFSFEDIYATAITPGAMIGLVGQNDIQRLRIWRQPMPASPSALEKGDALFAASDYAAALAEYRRLAPVANGAVRREAMYKAAVCLLSLSQRSDAMRQFEQVYAGNSDKWAAAAGIYIAWLLGEESKTPEAAALLQNVVVQFSDRSAFDSVPASIRNGVAMALVTGGGARSWGGGELLVIDEAGLERRKMAVRIAELISQDSWQLSATEAALLHAYGRLGQTAEALEFARVRCRNRPLLRQTDVQIVEDYASLLHQTGRSLEARTELGSRLENSPRGTERRLTTALRIQLARVFAGEGRWSEAEREIETYFRDGADTFHNYVIWSNACLVRGMIRQKKGDLAGALEAWRMGVVKVDGTGGGNSSKRDLNTLGPGQGMLNACILGGLTGDWGEPEGRYLLSRMSGETTGQGGQSATMLRGLESILPVRALYQCWQSARGKQLAWKLAMRECSIAEAVTQPPALMTEQFFLNGTDPVDDRQETLYWEIANAAINAYSTRKVGTEAMLSVGASWKGVTGFLGWGALELKLKAHPDLRCRCAYILGRRYLHLKKASEAERMFKISLEGAEPNSLLATLSAEELARLKRPG